MVTHDEMLRIARRYDTLPACAMRWCFRNFGSPVR